MSPNPRRLLHLSTADRSPLPSRLPATEKAIMAVCKRPAAVLDAGHATEQGADTCRSKKMRFRFVRSSEAYEMTDILGEGSFGIVKKARDRVTGKTVAIKFLFPSTGASELRQECRFLEACAGNPYVVRSHGLVRDHPNTTKTKLGLAMEYVGPNLEAFLSERPPLREATGGIVHRDIKPPNILVGEGGKILKFCDLGLAMSLATEKTPYKYAGTVPYIAPEMLLGKPDYDARVDVWSLGCVMSEMLTGGKSTFNDDKGDVVTTMTGQLSDIFSVLGLPDERTWPEFVSLPRAAAFPQWLPAPQDSRFRELFHEEMLSEDGFQVLKGLLECNPEKRLTAAAALQLPWFLPEIDTLPLPRKNVLRIKIPPPVIRKKMKHQQRIKTVPLAPPKVKKVRQIRNIVPTTATPKTKVPRIKFILSATPKERIVLRIPLAMWEKAHLIDTCKC
ncbi:unnamed protein product [Alopecurus aequalis]